MPTARCARSGSARSTASTPRSRQRHTDDSCGPPITRLSHPPPTPAERSRRSCPAASLLVAKRRRVIALTAAPCSLVRTGSPAASSFSFPVGAAVRSTLPPRQMRQCPVRLTVWRSDLGGRLLARHWRAAVVKCEGVDALAMGASSSCSRVTARPDRRPWAFTSRLRSAAPVSARGAA